MPLVSSKYPVVVDATAMSNYVRTMARYFSNLAKAKETPDEVDENRTCLAPELRPADGAAGHR
jgi:hypothetical protein